MDCNEENFVKTKEVLKELEVVLSCKLCGNILNDATTNTLCCHTFCKHCAQSLKNNCPLCFASISNESMQDDLQLSTLAALMNKFNEILSDKKKINLNSSEILENSGLDESGNDQTTFKRNNNKLKMEINEKIEGRKTPISKQKRNAKGETPLHIAAIKGNENSVLNLLQEGCNPNIKDNAGWTPLHEACNHGYSKIVELLLQHGANVNITGWENSTPLHDAVINNHCEVAEILLKYGADIGARDHTGKTPLEISITPEMKRILKVHSDKQIIPHVVTSFQSKSEKICLMMTGLNSDQKHTVEKCAKLLDFTIAKDYCNDVTHLVASCNVQQHCSRTLKFLQCILNGCWILDFCWIEKCIEKQEKISEEEYEITGAGYQIKTFGPRKARLNAERQNPPLFDGCEFYISGNFTPPLPSNEQLGALVKLGGGKLLTREPRSEVLDTDLTVPYHAQKENPLSKCTYFIISANSKVVVSDNTCRLSADWLLDSIGAFTLLNPT
ncbi:BRCA1-associated RING domain protein 1-like [Centruroides vittatus]|uniref:BRCA1-associated RING domain protein 1-like n=1 Tax=Centruroides vittatus TaxID=120091 RepID=UPI00351097C2